MTYEQAQDTAAFYAARGGGITEPIQMHGGEWAVKVIPLKQTARGAIIMGRDGKWELDRDKVYLVRIPKMQ